MTLLSFEGSWYSLLDSFGHGTGSTLVFSYTSFSGHGAGSTPVFPSTSCFWTQNGSLPSSPSSICGGSDNVPDVVFRLERWNISLMPAYLGIQFHWNPHLSPALRLGDRWDLILCLGELRRLIRVKTCPAV